MGLPGRCARFLLAAACFLVRPAGAEIVLEGSEFQVNTYTLDYQFGPSTVVVDAAGDFVVVWNSRGQDGSSLGVFGQRYAADGTALGDEFAVNTFTKGAQWAASVTPDGTGGFVVVWESGPESEGDGGEQDGSSSGIFARRFLGDGTPAGDEFPVNVSTTGPQRRPVVAADASGRFVVAWEGGDEYGNGDGSASGVFVRRFDATGVGLEPETLVNTVTAGAQRAPAIAAAGDGRFVVVWSSPASEDYTYRIVGRRFATSGAPLGPEFDVNQTEASGYGLAVGSNRGGEFVVSWVHSLLPEGGIPVFARRYAGDGTPRGDEFQVSEREDAYGSNPAVAVGATGEFVVTWTSYPDFASYQNIAARHFFADGTPSGPEFQANTTFSYLEFSSVSMAGEGRFVVAWDGAYVDGSYNGVLAQRFHQTATPPSTSTTTTTTLSTTTTTQPTEQPLACETLSRVARALCVLDRDRVPAVCKGQDLPASITTRIDRVRSAIAQADGADTKVARRLLKKALKLSRKLKPLARKAGRARTAPISSTCANALQTFAVDLGAAVRAALP